MHKNLFSWHEFYTASTTSYLSQLRFIFCFDPFMKVNRNSKIWTKRIGGWRNANVGRNVVKLDWHLSSWPYSNVWTFFVLFEMQALILCHFFEDASFISILCFILKTSNEDFYINLWEQCSLNLNCFRKESSVGQDNHWFY